LRHAFGWCGDQQTRIHLQIPKAERFGQCGRGVQAGQGQHDRLEAGLHFALGGNAKIATFYLLAPSRACPVERLQHLENWLKSRLVGDRYTIEPASADASFRRYFRVRAGSRTFIAMDAPPEQEDCRPYIHVAALFGAAGVHVPEVLEQDPDQGFLLLTDLESTTYLQALDDTTAPGLYADATDALLKIQLASREGELPPYGAELLMREMRLFPDWYVARHRGARLAPAQADKLEAVFALVLENNLAQPRVYVHRDYHSRNLMVTAPNPGILDFQDAVYGPITYDLVSLFKDAYVSWDEERVLDWVIRYWEKAKRARLPVAADFSEFFRDFEWMGVQRHIKVLGIFARLCHRDGKDAYLKDMPLVMQYLRRACERYRTLEPMLELLDEIEGKPELSVGYSF
jgi:N-acetylmuramate 1-kinase